MKDISNADRFLINRDFASAILGRVYQDRSHPKNAAVSGLLNAPTAPSAVECKQVLDTDASLEEYQMISDYEHYEQTGENRHADGFAITSK